jgi:hypothetical protein
MDIGNAIMDREICRKKRELLIRHFYIMVRYYDTRLALQYAY